MLLKEICTPDVACCNAGTTVLAAARLMRQKHVGDLVVVDDPEGDQTPLGIVTDRDIVLEVLGRDRDPGATAVHEIMRGPAVVARETEDSAVALERMKLHGVRRLPVLGLDRKLVGIVSLDDLLRQLASDAALIAEVVAREQTREQRSRR